MSTALNSMHRLQSEQNFHRYFHYQIITHLNFLLFEQVIKFINVLTSTLPKLVHFFQSSPPRQNFPMITKQFFSFKGRSSFTHLMFRSHREWRCLHSSRLMNNKVITLISMLKIITRRQQEKKYKLGSCLIHGKVSPFDFALRAD